MKNSLIVFILSGAIFYLIIHAFQDRVELASKPLRTISNEIQTIEIGGFSNFEFKKILEKKMALEGARIFFTTEEGLYLLEAGIGQSKIFEGEISNLEVSEQGDRAAFFLKGEKSYKLMLWEEGFGEEQILDKPFSKPTEIEFSNSGRSILLSGSEEKEASVIKILTRKSTERLKNKKAESKLKVEVKRLKDFTTPKLSGDKEVYEVNWTENQVFKRVRPLDTKRTAPDDINKDGASDFLLFSPGRDLPYLQAYTTNGFDAAIKKPASLRGAKVTWRIGENTSVPFTGDFDGDGLIDFGTLSPKFFEERNTEENSISLYLSNGHSLYAEPEKAHKIKKLDWGLGGHKLLVGDFDGDRKSDLGFFDGETGLWQLLYSGGNFNEAKASQATPGYGLHVVFGKNELPTVGDFNGDGLTDLATYTISKQGRMVWTLQMLKNQGKNLGQSRKIVFGVSGDIPIIGDFNCNGKSDISVFNPENNTWSFRYGKENIKKVKWIPQGATGHLEPLTGDFDGDGCSDMAYFEKRTGVHGKFHALPTSLEGGSFEVLGKGYNTVISAEFGRVRSEPVQVLLRKHQMEKIIKNEEES